MDSLNLKSLVEVARTGSFSRAAENLFVTQSAVSRRIKCLEDEYGCPLLDRNGVTVKPTPAGKIVISEATRILAIETTIIRRLDELNQAPVITFACTHPFGICYLPDILKRYQDRYCHLGNFRTAFEMPHMALQGLIEGRFDLIVIEHWEALDLPGYLALPLPEDEMIFISSPRLGLATPTVSIEQLLPHRLYRRKEECCSWKFLKSRMEAAGRQVSEFTDTLVYDDLHVIMQWVMNGEGIALMSRDLVREHLSQGKILEHRVLGFDHRRRRSLIMREHAALDEAGMFFIESIFASCGREVPEAVNLLVTH